MGRAAPHPPKPPQSPAGWGQGLREQSQLRARAYGSQGKLIPTVRGPVLSPWLLPPQPQAAMSQGEDRASGMGDTCFVVHASLA